MPIMLTGKMSLDAVETDVLYTLQSLRMDPQAADLEQEVIPWLQWIEEVRAEDRTFREKEVAAAASRLVSNLRLDSSCRDFARDLEQYVRSDLTSPEFTRFFPIPVEMFVSDILDRQIAHVQAWLTLPDHPVLEPHREALKRWSDACDHALSITGALSKQRELQRLRHDDLAADLNDRRARVHQTLVERARVHALPSSWPDLFFMSVIANSR